jgi:long-chain acyl-CoA synthetase
MNLARMLDDHVDAHGDYDALFFEGEWHSTGKTLDRARRVAGGLRDLGVGEGDRVVVLLPNCPEVGIAYWAAWRIGAAVTPVIFLLPPPEINRILVDSEAKVAITSPELLLSMQLAADGVDTLQHIVLVTPDAEAPEGTMKWDALETGEGVDIVERSENDLAALLYTGGTTGASKGVMLSHENLSWTAKAAAEASELEPGENGLLALPLSHGFGLHVSILGALQPGKGTLLRWFDPTAMLDMIEAHKVSRMAVVPTMLQMLLAMPLEERDLSSLRYITSGAAGLPGEIQRAFEERVPNCKILQGYGLTETSPTVAVQSPSSAEDGSRRIGSVGKVVDGCEVRIVDDEGKETPAGEPGEVTVKGPNVMQGYWRNPEATAEAIKDGWFHTGDVGRIDDEGNLYIVERKKDLVIRGGFNVFPADVEGVLLKHPGIAEVAVVGRPSERWGEEPVAFVVVTGAAAPTEEELTAFCEENLAVYKRPAAFRFVDAIPKTPVGKIDKKNLRTEL